MREAGNGTPRGAAARGTGRANNHDTWNLVTTKCNCSSEFISVGT